MNSEYSIKQRNRNGSSDGNSLSSYISVHETDAPSPAAAGALPSLPPSHSSVNNEVNHQSPTDISHVMATPSRLTPQTTGRSLEPIKFLKVSYEQVHGVILISESFEDMEQAARDMFRIPDTTPIFIFAEVSSFNNERMMVHRAVWPVISSEVAIIWIATSLESCRSHLTQDSLPSSRRTPRPQASPNPLRMVQQDEVRGAIITCIPSIIGILTSDSPDVRSAAVHALGKLVENAQHRGAIFVAIPAIIRLFKDQDPNVRMAAVTTLGKMGEQVEFRDAIVTAIPSIILLLGDSDSGYRCSSASDVNNSTKAHAAAALSKLGEQAEFRGLIATSVSSIIQLFHNKDPSVQVAAATALGKMGEHAEFRALITAAAPSIIVLLSSDNSSAQLAAITFMKLVKHIEIRVAITIAISSQLPQSSRKAQSVSTAAADKLGGKSENITAVVLLIVQLLKSSPKVQLALALGKMGEQAEFRAGIVAAIPSIVELLDDDKDSDTPSIAAIALCMISEHVEDRDMIANVIPSIIGVLNNQEKYGFHRAAAIALGKVS